MLLILMSVAMPVAFSTWTVLLNNFVVERAAFTGVEIGILQSLREIPGFLAFTTIFVSLILREQTLVVAALAVVGLGVALTGFFPFEYGLYCTTLLMSVGFHYFEAVKQSLALQWLSRDEAPRVFGKLISVGAVTSLLVYGAIWILLEILAIDYIWIFVLAGGVCFLMALFMWLGFPHFKSSSKQHTHLVLRKRYWLYYGLIFLSGARRQIF
ncbi:MAG: MFS transporter, partial [Gammaproteobacteria bacterium]|nr:MFS transporter [Gammaproteobacteria bacterium]